MTRTYWPARSQKFHHRVNRAAARAQLFPDPLCEVPGCGLGVNHCLGHQGRPWLQYTQLDHLLHVMQPGHQRQIQASGLFGYFAVSIFG